MQTAIVNLRTAKIQLLQLLNDRTPVDQFDVTGPFDFSDALAAARRLPPDRAEQPARSAGGAGNHPAVGDQPQAGGRQRLDRPDLRAWYTWNSSNNNPNGIQTLGAQREHSAAHLRPQPGRKAAHADRHRPQPARPARPRARRSSATWTRPTRRCDSNIALLKPYKAKYNDEALQGARHRDLRLRARRRIADGFSECAERLPPGATGLRATDRRLPDRRRHN